MMRARARAAAARTRAFTRAAIYGERYAIRCRHAPYARRARAHLSPFFARLPRASATRAASAVPRARTQRRDASADIFRHARRRCCCCRARAKDARIRAALRAMRAPARIIRAMRYAIIMLMFCAMMILLFSDFAARRDIFAPMAPCDAFPPRRASVRHAACITHTPLARLAGIVLHAGQGPRAER